MDEFIILLPTGVQIPVSDCTVKKTGDGKTGVIEVPPTVFCEAMAEYFANVGLQCSEIESQLDED